MSVIEIRDDRMKDIVAPDVELGSISDEFVFTEGPIWNPHDNTLIFSDIKGNTMYKWHEATGVEVFRKPSNMANGNFYDRQGRILTCEHATSRVTRTHPDGSYEILATHYDGKELNSPNDIVVKSDGNIYFTDPMPGRTAMYGIEREPDLPFRGVYRLNADTKALTLLVDDFELPNGLCFSPDESQLYVNDTANVHIRVFDVKDDGTIDAENGRVFAELTGDLEGYADGMKFDSAGNLFSAGPGGVHILTGDGTALGVILIPQPPTNFNWGSDDLQTLFITAGTTVYTVRLKVPGRTPNF